MNNYSFRFEGKRFSSDDPPDENVRLSELRQIAEAAGDGDRLHVLEWGSGFSTLLLAEVVQEKPGGGSLVSIDHTPGWQAAVWQSLPSHERVVPVMADLEGSLDPQSQSTSYSTIPLDLVRRDPTRWPWDLIVIDGRRRMECALTAALVAVPKTVVILHDYRRLRYQHIGHFLQVVKDGLHYRQMRTDTTICSFAGHARRMGDEPFQS